MSMSDARPFVPRGRGRGYQGNQNHHQNHQNQQNQHFYHDDDQAMYDANSRGRGRGRGTPRGPRGGHNHFQPSHSRHGEPMDAEEKKRLEQNPAYKLMKDFLGRRYNPQAKLLDLSTIAADQEIIESGMFATEGAQKKFFPALMKVCDAMLDTPEAKEAAVESVTLAGNNLENTHVVYTLVHSFRNIKNLDLSNNRFTIQSLQPWKGRFRNLEHLVVDPMQTPGWQEELISWFPRLKLLNGNQIRPDNNTNTIDNNNNIAPQSTTPVPSGTNISTPGMMVDPDQQRKEEMVLYVQQQTNLKRDYAVQCLEAANWNIGQAGVLFQQSQGTLPPDAYN